MAVLLKTYTRLKWLRVHNDMIMMVVNIDNLIIICDHSWKTQNFFSSCHPLWSCLGLITSKLLFEIFFEKNKTLITLLLGTAIRVHMGCHPGSGRKKTPFVKNIGAHSGGNSPKTVDQWVANVGCYGYPLKQYTFESTLFSYEPLFKHNFWWNAINWVRKSSSKIQFQNNLYQLLELWLYILKFSQYLWYLLIMIPLQCLKISSPFLKSIFAVLQKYLCHLSL